jgi:Ca2+-binding RTX toxin-like protein
MALTSIVELNFDYDNVYSPATGGGAIFVTLDRKLATGEVLSLTYGSLTLDIPAGQADGDYSVPGPNGGDIYYSIREGGTSIIKYAPGFELEKNDKIIATVSNSAETGPTSSVTYSTWSADDDFLNVGSVVPGTTFVDALGIQTRLVNGNSTQLALLDIGGEWCPGSVEIASTDAELMAGLNGAFDYKTILLTDEAQRPADTADAANWSHAYGLSTDVLTLNGNPEEVYLFGKYSGQTIYPTFVVADQVTGEVLARFDPRDLDWFDTMGTAVAAKANEVFDYIATLAATEGIVRNGSEVGDYLAGSVRADTIRGAGGDDFLEASWGNDRLQGGDGQDLLWGGAGRDRIFGGEGDDQLGGQAGSDYLDGGAGFDVADLSDETGALVVALHSANSVKVLAGGKVIDELVSVEGVIGGSGHDQLKGDRGANFLDGGSGNDFLNGRGTATGERDVLSGGAGEDILFLRSGSATLDGGSGADRFVIVAGNADVFGYDVSDVVDFRRAKSAVTVDVDRNTGTYTYSLADGGEGRLAFLDKVRGTAFNDVLRGNGDGVLNGEAGNDRISGEFGADTLTEATARIGSNSA